MTDTRKPVDPRAAREREEKERELLCKLPEDAHPAEERGERVETAKAIASGGKSGTDACEIPDTPSRGKPSGMP
jgi:hypothetical protein